MKILISNDDGYQADGILCLSRLLSDFSSEVVLFAPDRNRSASSYSISRTHIDVEQVSERVYKVFGTPSDCMMIALRGFFDWRPDFVFSGINLGANLSTDVIYSGTIAVAMQAFWHGVPSVAFSLCSHNPDYFETAEHVVRLFLENYFSSFSDKSSCCLSVNIPGVPVDHWRGFAYADLGRRELMKPPTIVKESDSHYACLLGEVSDFVGVRTNHDCWAVKNGYASVTPLRFLGMNEDLSFCQAPWMVRF